MLIIFTSCTEEIDIDLNKIEPQVMIEALVSTNGETNIKLSQSINFDEPNEFPAIQNAIVELSDNYGNNEVLSEQSPGVYTSSSLTGNIGYTYNLIVTTENESYSSSCQIPQQVPMDSITISKVPDNSLRGNSNDSILKVTVFYKDPEGIDNYYHFIEYRNNEKIKSYIINDKFNDGLEVERNLNYRDRELESGDTLKIEMRCISAEVYEYLDDLNSLSAMSATPTNPRTNIENATIGYFSAHTSEIKFLVY